jgi:hypothetical protein
VIEQVAFRGALAELDSFALGASRIGGPPDLPTSIAWPESNGQRLPLILQLALVDIAAFPAARILPRDGVLLFFALPWVEDLGLSNVRNTLVYVPAGLQLVRGAALSEETTPICRIVDLAAAQGLDQDSEQPEVHVLFPARKYSVIFGTVPNDEYTPLLELQSDYDVGMNWGDAAWITWSLPKADLAARRFDRSIASIWIG